VAALLATYQGGWVFALFWLLAAEAVLFEWLAMTRSEPQPALPLLLGSLLCALSFGVLSRYLGLLDGIAVFVVALNAAALAGHGWRDRGWAATGYGYAAVIALVPPMVREHPALGIAGVVWIFAVVWTTDVAGFFIGRAIGGPKLWPAISPKKTWSGFLGGVIASAAAGALAAVAAERFGWHPPASLPVIVVISATASILSQLGDLAESALKRRFGAKDSGRLIPGHGGVMDRLDGFWAVAALLGVVLAVGAV
jgi:phosphatidate cytidylyltransferase